MARQSIRITGQEDLIRKLRQTGANVEAILEEAVHAAAQVINDAAEEQAPGPHIEQETTRKTPRRVVVGVGPDKKRWYYKFAEAGAGAHDIRAKKKKALSFEGQGGAVVVGGVRHPGQQARPFLRPAIDNNAGEATAAMGDRLKSAVESEAH